MFGFTKMRPWILCALLLQSPAIAWAQNYPTRPITLKVAFPAGGPVDVGARAAGVVMERELGKGIIVENVPGANGSLGVAAVLKALPDGYTILATTGIDFVAAPKMIPSAKYRPEDFKLLGVIGESDFVLISSTKHNFRSVAELIRHAGSKENKELTLAHWGPGSSPHVVGTDFQKRLGIAFLEVPYKGVAPVVADMLGGHVDLTFVPLSAGVLDLIRSGQVNIIAIAGAKRSSLVPDAPTMNETPELLGFEYSLWSAVFAPPATPDGITAQLNSAMNAWLSSADYRQRVQTNLTKPFEAMNVEQAQAFFRSEREKYKPILDILAPKQ